MTRARLTCSLHFPDLSLRTKVSTTQHIFFSRSHEFTNTKNLWEFCATFVPVPGTSVKPVPPFHNARGTGTAFLYPPGTSGSSVRPCQFRKTFIPVPGTSVSSVWHSYPYPELLWALYAPCNNTRGIPGVRVQHFLHPPGTYVISVRPCHNIRTSVSSGTLPYPYLTLLEDSHTRTRNSQTLHNKILQNYARDGLWVGL